MILVTNLKSVGVKSPFKDHRDSAIRAREREWESEREREGWEKGNGWRGGQRSNLTDASGKKRIQGLDSVAEDLNFHFLPRYIPASDVSVSRAGTPSCCP